MSTLLLRLAGPLQSWGVSSKYDVRSSGREPSKSGVIGIIASAMGRCRDDSVDDLAQLRFGARIDQEGILLHDFHTARSSEGNDVFVTHRYYVADAAYIVGLEGDEMVLKKIDSAIKAPAHPIFLGRRSCPPAGKISLGIRDTSLVEALKKEPWTASEWYKKKHNFSAQLEIVVDSEDGCGVTVRDYPVSFSQKKREHSFRTVSHDVCGVVISKDDETFTQHDPFSTIGGE